jgi:hypothetical protein
VSEWKLYYAKAFLRLRIEATLRVAALTRELRLTISYSKLVRFAGLSLYLNSMSVLMWTGWGEISREAWELASETSVTTLTLSSGVCTGVLWHGFLVIISFMCNHT